MHTTKPMNKLEIGAFLGATRAAVDRLIVAGMPVLADEHGRQRFSPPAVARWLLLRSEQAATAPEAEQRARLLKARADAAELRNERERQRQVVAPSRLVF